MCALKPLVVPVLDLHVDMYLGYAENHINYLHNNNNYYLLVGPVFVLFFLAMTISTPAPSHHATPGINISSVGDTSVSMHASIYKIKICYILLILC